MSEVAEMMLIGKQQIEINSLLHRLDALSTDISQRDQLIASLNLEIEDLKTERDHYKNAF